MRRAQGYRMRLSSEPFYAVLIFKLCECIPYLNITYMMYVHIYKYPEFLMEK